MKIFVLYNATALPKSQFDVHNYDSLKGNVFSFATGDCVGVLLISSNSTLPNESKDFVDGQFVWVEPESRYYHDLEDEWLYLLQEQNLKTWYHTVSEKEFVLCAVSAKSFDIKLISKLEHYFTSKVAILESVPATIQNALETRGWHTLTSCF